MGQKVLNLALFTTSLKSEPSAFENTARCPNSETKLQRSDYRPMSSPSLVKLGPQNHSVLPHPENYTEKMC